MRVPPFVSISNIHIAHSDVRECLKTQHYCIAYLVKGCCLVGLCWRQKKSVASSKAKKLIRATDWLTRARERRARVHHLPRAREEQQQHVLESTRTEKTKQRDESGGEQESCQGAPGALRDGRRESADGEDGGHRAQCIAVYWRCVGWGRCGMRTELLLLLCYCRLICPESDECHGRSRHDAQRDARECEAIWWAA